MPGKDTAKTELALKKHRIIAFLVLVIFVVLIFVIGVFVANHQNHTRYKDVQIGRIVFRLEVADTQVAWEKGLSGRSSLAKNSGMFFDFKSAGNWRMWMINMYFDIDMAWLNQNGQIIYIKSDVAPSTYPQTFGTNIPSWYVIEVPSNTFNNLNVHAGDSIKIN